MKKFIIFFLFAHTLGAQIALIQWDDKGIYNDIAQSFITSLPWGVDKYCVYADEHKVASVVERVQARDYKCIVTIGDPVFQTAAKTINNVPIVFMGVMNPGKFKNDSNVTGILMEVAIQDKIALVKQLIPAIKKVGIILSTSTPYVQSVEEKLKSQGINVEPALANNPGGVNTALRFMPDIDLLWMIPDPLNRDNVSFKFMLMFSLKNKVPLYGLSMKYVKMGATFTIEPNISFVGKEGAKYVKDIVDGKSITDLPVLYSKGAFVINKKMADKIRLYIPEDVLKNAQEIIE